MRKSRLFIRRLATTDLYPIFLNLSEKKCLVLGLGQTGTRKLAGLLSCGPSEILALDLRPLQDLPASTRQLLHPPVKFECRSWHENDLAGCFLAFACSNDSKINVNFAKACSERNIACNCVSPPEAGSFYLGARVKSEPFQIAISSSGASPLLVAEMKTELEKWLSGKSQLALFMKHLRRELLKVSKNSIKNREIFCRVLNSQIPVFFDEKNFSACKKLLCEIAPDLSACQIELVFSQLKDEIS